MPRPARVPRCRLGALNAAPPARVMCRSRFFSVASAIPTCTPSAVSGARSRTRRSRDMKSSVGCSPQAPKSRPSASARWSVSAAWSAAARAARAAPRISSSIATPAWSARTAASRKRPAKRHRAVIPAPSSSTNGSSSASPRASIRPPPRHSCARASRRTRPFATGIRGRESASPSSALAGWDTWRSSWPRRWVRTSPS